MGARGPKPVPAGESKSQQRVLATLAASVANGSPLTLRASELATRAKVKEGNLARITAPLVDAGMVIKCSVKHGRGRPRFEYRIAAGSRRLDPAPLDTRRTDVARGDFRGARALPDRPRTVPAPPSLDGAMTRRVQAMSAEEFGKFVEHLSRIWQWAHPVAA